jgi:hypothetical protein
MLPEGITARAGAYGVQEVWSGAKPTGATVQCSGGRCDPLTVEVEKYGGTTYVRLVLQ